MADYVEQKIKDLPLADSADETDDLIIESSPASGTPTTKRTKLGTLATFVKYFLKIGDASSLGTSNKDSLVNAINELNNQLKVVDVTSQFKPSTNLISIISAYKYGKLISVHGYLLAGYKKGWHTTETITTPYPPTAYVSFNIGSQNSGDSNTVIRLDYRPSGAVYGTVSADLTGNNLYQLIYLTA